MKTAHHHVTAELIQALNDTGWTIPAQAACYWVGEAMQKTDFKDLPQVPDNVQGLAGTSCCQNCSSGKSATAELLIQGCRTQVKPALDQHPPCRQFLLLRECVIRGTAAEVRQAAPLSDAGSATKRLCRIAPTRSAPSAHPPQSYLVLRLLLSSFPTAITRPTGPRPRRPSPRHAEPAITRRGSRLPGAHVDALPSTGRGHCVITCRARTHRSPGSTTATT